MLSCAENPLTNLHGISSLTQLESLYCGFCDLTSLPDLRGFSNLTELNCTTGAYVSNSPFWRSPLMQYLALNFLNVPSGARLTLKTHVPGSTLVVALSIGTPTQQFNFCDIRQLDCFIIATQFFFCVIPKDNPMFFKQLF